MHVEYWTYCNVPEDGVLDEGRGAVRTEPSMQISGQHWTQTESIKSAGLWISVSTGRLRDGTIHGITVYFADEDEMRHFSRHRKWGNDHRKPPTDPDDPTLKGDWWKS